MVSGYQSIGQINNNLDKIETAFDNTLSRDGSYPNTMGATLDMNSHQIINLAAPTNANDAARLYDVLNALELEGVALPALQAGKFLTNDGANLSWDTASGIFGEYAAEDYSLVVGSGNTPGELTAAGVAVRDAGGGTLRFETGTYGFTAKGASLYGKVRYQGRGKFLTTLDFSADTTYSSTGILRALDTSNSGPVAWRTVGAAVSKGATTLTSVAGDLSGFTTGSHIMIRSTEFGLPHVNDTLKHTFTGSAEWAADAVTKGEILFYRNRYYVVTTAGTLSATPATSEVNPVTSGTATLYYLPWDTINEYQVARANSTAYSLGNIRVTPEGYILVCVTAGTSASSQPTFSTSNSSSAAQTDGTAAWRYLGYYNARKGELVQTALDRVSGTTIYLTTALADSYPQTYASSGVTFTVEVSVVNLLDIEISDMTIKGSGITGGTLGSASGSGTALYYEGGTSRDIGVQVMWTRLVLRNVRFIDIEQYQVHQLCSFVKTIDCDFIHSSTHLESQQYGVFVQAAGGLIHIRPLCINSRHLDDGDGGISSTNYYQGIPSYIMSVGSIARGVWQSVSGSHRDVHLQVITDFNWDVLICGFKPRGPNWVLANGAIRAPRYATSAEYVAQEGVISIYYQASNGIIRGVNLTGGLYGLRVSNSDGVLKNLDIDVSSEGALLYSARIGAYYHDRISDSKFTIHSRNPTSSHVFLDGSIDNCVFRTTYLGGAKVYTNENKKTQILDSSFFAEGETCTSEVYDIYNSKRSVFGGGRCRSDSTNIVHRFVDITHCMIQPMLTYFPGTGNGFNISGTSAGTATYVHLCPQLVISADATGTAIVVDNDTTQSRFEWINTNCASGLSKGTGTGNSWANP